MTLNLYQFSVLLHAKNGQIFRGSAPNPATASSFWGSAPDPRTPGLLAYVPRFYY
jgi:hypothetical protein